MSATTTDPTLQELADRAELTDLVSRLGRWLDGGAADDALDVLSDDVTVDTPGGRASGRDAVVAQARRNHDVPTQHLITNLLAEIDGETATVSANALVSFVSEPGGPGALTALAGRYDLVARRTAAGWSLTSITIRPVGAGAA